MSERLFRALIEPLPSGSWSVTLVQYFTEDEIGKRPLNTARDLAERYDVKTRGATWTERGARRLAERMLRRLRRADDRLGRSSIMLGGSDD
jgi:hypothetical protein